MTAWLLCSAAVQAVVAAAVSYVFVFTGRGQWTETAALQGNAIGRERVTHVVDAVLDPISALSVAVAIAAVTFIALVRRRFALAVAACVLVIGANLATQVLKNGIIDRPALGVDAVARTENSLPSGHTTVAASVVLALVLVLPPKVRGVAALVGAAYAALTGVATLAAGWHRPADVVVAYLVVGAWAALVSIPLVHTHRGRPVRRARGHRLAVAVLVVGGLALLAYGALALRVAYGVTPPDYTRTLLLAAYVGGAVTIAGTACLVVAGLLAVVHRVVPGRLPAARVPHPRPAGDRTASRPSPLVR